MPAGPFHLALTCLVENYKKRVFIMFLFSIAKHMFFDRCHLSFHFTSLDFLTQTGIHSVSGLKWASQAASLLFSLLDPIYLSNFITCLLSAQTVKERERERANSILIIIALNALNMITSNSVKVLVNLSCPIGQAVKYQLFLVLKMTLCSLLLCTEYNGKASMLISMLVGHEL